MGSNLLFQVRVTGLLVEDGRILLVQQQLSDGRGWSLPGGRPEQGETLQEAIVREMLEETGLTVKVLRLVYLCERVESEPPLLHISFLLQWVGGSIRKPNNEFDANPISDVRFVPIEGLPAYGFSEDFTELARNGFPGEGYRGPKSSIGL